MKEALEHLEELKIILYKRLSNSTSVQGDFQIIEELNAVKKTIEIIKKEGDLQDPEEENSSTCVCWQNQIFYFEDLITNERRCNYCQKLIKTKKL